MAGFECEFQVQPPEVLPNKCPVCLLILREPYQATCCGKSFCKECVESVKTRSNKCPTCKTVDFFSYPNLGLQQSLYDFRVYCTHKSRGCEWTGELRELDNHLNSDPPADKALQGCLYTVLSCPLCPPGRETTCRLPRKDMEAHISGNHKTLDMLLELAQMQSFKLEIQSLKAKLEESEAEKLALKCHVTELEERPSKVNAKQDSVLSYSEQWPVGPGEVFLTNFELRRKMGEAWYSPPFYTHPHGYKMCLEVHCNGRNAGMGSHVSLFVNLVQGEYDEQLKWPFCGDVTIQLLNQEGGRRHCKRTVHFHDWCQTTGGNGGSGGGRMTEVGVVGGCGLGFPTFVAHTELRPKLLKNDCLRFRVSKIKLKL